MTTDRRKLRRALIGPALAVCMLPTACSDEAPVAQESEASASAAATETPSATVDEGTSSRAADELLADAVAGLGSRYRFDSVITTAAGETVSVIGVRVDSASQYSAEAAGATLEVVVVDNAVWIRQDGSDEWLSSGENPAGDPLAPLATPLTIVRRDPTDSSTLLATYNGAEIGLESSAATDVEVFLSDDSITFEAAANGTRMSTTLTADNSLEPIRTPVTS